jgi:hypothetical protein
MDQPDPQQRIAELELQLAQQKRIADLERQLAEAKAAAGAHPVEQPSDVSAAQLAAIDEHARRLAQALQADRSQPFGGPGAAPLREALSRAVVDAGLSQQQYKDVLARAGLRAGGTIKVGGQVVYQRCDPSDPVFLAPTGRRALEPQQQPRRKFAGADLLGVIIAVVGGGIGLCVGIAAAVTALIPSTALWMGPIVCRGGYAMAYNTSHYSYKLPMRRRRRLLRRQRPRRLCAAVAARRAPAVRRVGGGWPAMAARAQGRVIVRTPGGYGLGKDLAPME